MKYEDEEEAIIEQFNRGEISKAEMLKELRELRYDYQAAAEESAQRAYDEEMARW